GPALRASGAHTLTLFGLHMPARLFRADPEGAREEALRATLASFDSALAEPVEDCLLRAPDGTPCLEVKTPVDLEDEVGLPGGHIFHRDLSWPFAEDPAEAGRWGVETAHPRVLLCGAGARRGGGVSGIPGHNAARAVLDAGQRPAARCSADATRCGAGGGRTAARGPSGRTTWTVSGPACNASRRTPSPSMSSSAWISWGRSVRRFISWRLAVSTTNPVPNRRRNRVGLPDTTHGPSGQSTPGRGGRTAPGSAGKPSTGRDGVVSGESRYQNGSASLPESMIVRGSGCVRALSRDSSRCARCAGVRGTRNSIVRVVTRRFSSAAARRSAS